MAFVWTPVKTKASQVVRHPPSFIKLARFLADEEFGFFVPYGGFDRGFLLMGVGTPTVLKKEKGKQDAEKFSFTSQVKLEKHRCLENYGRTQCLINPPTTRGRSRCIGVGII